MSPLAELAAASDLYSIMLLRLAASRFSRIGRVKSRAQSMKRSATGLSALFLSVTTFTGHGRGGKSTGKTFRDLKYATDRGMAVM
jgi:hypothetical protein